MTGAGKVGCVLETETSCAEVVGTGRDVAVAVFARFARDFRQGHARATAGSSDEHADVAPDLFTEETQLGTYQGMTDPEVMSRTPGSFRTVARAARLEQTRVTELLKPS